MNNERNYGIDLLRMISMFMICVLHVLGYGGVINSCDYMSGNYYTAWLFETCAYCSVNIFGMISGYISYGSKHKYKSLINIWLMVFFYSTLITAVFVIFKPGYAGVKTLLKSMLPVTFNQYWYFTQYFAAFLAFPFLDKAIENLERKNLQKILVTALIIYSVMPTLRHGDIFITCGGYSAIWLMFLYCAGAYVRKYDVLKNAKTGVLLLFYFLLTAASLGVKIITDIVMPHKFADETLQKEFLISYTSPTIVIASLLLLVCFARLDLNSISKKIIGLCAPSAFAVFIINCHPLLYDYFMKDTFSGYSEKPVYLLFILIPASALVVYVVCTAVDIVRIQLFRIFRTHKLSGFLSDKADLILEKLGSLLTKV